MESTTNFIVQNDLTEDTTWESYRETETDFDLTTEDKIVHILWKFVPPVILVCGTFGNIMILIIQCYQSPGGAMNSISVFLCTLAVSDLFLLVSLLRQWLFYAWALDLTSINDIVCKGVIFAVYSFTLISPWCLVCLTIQRMMSVVWPHRIHVFCTQRKAQLTLVVVVILLVALSAHHLASSSLVQFTNASDAECCVDDTDRDMEHFVFYVYPWLDFLFSSLLPSLILFIGNAVLATSVVRAARHASSMTSQPTSGQNRTRQKHAVSLTALVISVSVINLVLTLPINIQLVIEMYLDAAATNPGAELAWAINNMLWYSNSAVNFYVYCLTGTKFRTECKRLLLCSKGQVRDRTSSVRTELFVVS